MGISHIVEDARRRRPARLRHRIALCRTPLAYLSGGRCRHASNHVVRLARRTVRLNSHSGPTTPISPTDCKRHTRLLRGPVCTPTPYRQIVERNVRSHCRLHSRPAAAERQDHLPVITPAGYDARGNIAARSRYGTKVVNSVETGPHDPRRPSLRTSAYGPSGNSGGRAAEERTNGPQKRTLAEYDPTH